MERKNYSSRIRVKQGDLIVLGYDEDIKHLGDKSYIIVGEYDCGSVNGCYLKNAVVVEHVAKGEVGEKSDVGKFYKEVYVDACEWWRKATEKDITVYKSLIPIYDVIVGVLFFADDNSIEVDRLHDTKTGVNFQEVCETDNEICELESYNIADAYHYSDGTMENTIYVKDAKLFKQIDSLPRMKGKVKLVTHFPSDVTAGIAESVEDITYTVRPLTKQEKANMMDELEYHLTKCQEYFKILKNTAE